MPRSRSETLTPREAQIMEVLWAKETATAEEVREALPVALHDSTVRTLLRVLESKGYVRHRTRGKSFVYRASVAREAIETRAVKSLLQRFFGGSAEALVMRLIEDEHLTPAQIDELRSPPRGADSSRTGRKRASTTARSTKKRRKKS